MKKAISIFSFMLLFGYISASAQTPACNGATACNTAKAKSTCAEDQKANQIKVYYFHATRRCATCQAVESVSKEAIKEYYGDKISFESINREEEKDNSLITKHQVSGQTLLIIKGDKVVNLTNDAFLNALSNPDKLKSKIKSTIDSMM